PWATWWPPSSRTSATRPLVCAARVAWRTASTTPSHARPPAASPAGTTSVSRPSIAAGSRAWSSPEQAASAVASSSAGTSRRGKRSVIAGPLLEGAAAAHAQLREDLGCRAEAGEGGLQQVQADEGGQQQPPRREEVGQRQAGEDHHAGKGEDCAIEVHVGSPVGVGSGVGISACA